ncbi:MAG: signal peptide peptidase SppA [Patescibacteria group bacterium]|nr:signal peptide peptidase SppA [Patescibacteria group bacterium]
MDSQSPQNGSVGNPNSAQNASIAAQAAYAGGAPVAGLPPQRRSHAGAWTLLVLLVLGAVGLLVLGLAAVGALATLAGTSGEARVREEFVSHNESASRKIAIIAIEGVIMDEVDGFVKRQIDHVLKDEQVAAIVLRINSPGGTISGSDYLHHHLRKLADERELPIVASMGGIAASGGYYVAMAVGDAPDSIFAEPTTFTGSIGVIIPRYDLSQLLEKWGVEYDAVASGKFKSMGNMARPMTEEERALFQQIVDEGFGQFKDVIRSGRPKFREEPETLDALATGQIFTSGQAVENGLVDRVGFIEAAVDRAIEIAKLDPANVKVVRYKREPSLAGLLMGGEARGRTLDLQAVLELTTPRAYYLCTWLPPLHGRP